ncbi:hypothetical protein ACUIJN_24830 [Metabacillus halosaccharovorans]|uniref:hypothetical protein n=1 Tax=Metabacillus halosaccharovorans TaxID=930124 RepID=UPI00203E99C2|nr:hypothetical protein [Metabacillus halosaccharovorans]MCM3443110.1 hypothetical protein [Metabacillus halosaccharovorans]
MAPGQTETLTLELKKGIHKFYVKNDGVYKTKELQFNVESEEPINLYFQTKATFGIKLWKN